MISIKFDADLKHKIYAAHDSWLAEIKKQPGLLAASDVLLAASDVWIEGHKIGNIANFKVSPGFVQFLKETNIPFDIE